MSPQDPATWLNLAMMFNRGSLQNCWTKTKRVRRPRSKGWESTFTTRILPLLMLCFIIAFVFYYFSFLLFLSFCLLSFCLSVFLSFPGIPKQARTGTYFSCGQRVGVATCDVCWSDFDDSEHRSLNSPTWCQTLQRSFMFAAQLRPLAQGLAGM